MNNDLRDVLVRGVLARVPEVCIIYHNSTLDKRNLIEQNIVLDYEDECRCMSDFMSIEEYVEDKDNSIGWCWIEDPLME